MWRSSSREAGAATPMNNPRFLLPAAALTLVFLGVRWFGDHLWSRFWILVFPLYLLLIGCFVALLVQCIRRIREKAYAEYASIAVLALLLVTVVCFPFRDTKVKLELQWYDAPRQEVLEMIRSEKAMRNIPVFFLTGKDDSESVNRVLKLKPDGYILKSVGRNSLLERLEEFFAGQS